MIGLPTFWRDCPVDRVVHLSLDGGECASGRVTARSLLAVRLVEHDGDAEAVRWRTIWRVRSGPTWERQFQAAADSLAATPKAKLHPTPTPAITEAEIEALAARQVAP